MPAPCNASVTAIFTTLEFPFRRHRHQGASAGTPSPSSHARTILPPVELVTFPRPLSISSSLRQISHRIRRERLGLPRRIRHRHHRSGVRISRLASPIRSRHRLRPPNPVVNVRRPMDLRVRSMRPRRPAQLPSGEHPHGANSVLMIDTQLDSVITPVFTSRLPVPVSTVIVRPNPSSVVRVTLPAPVKFGLV